jgi:hypothetical protein
LIRVEKEEGLEYIGWMLLKLWWGGVGIDLMVGCRRAFLEFEELWGWFFLLKKLK